MHATQSSAQARSWWYEPRSWLLMTGSFVAMIGCGVTIWLVISHLDVATYDNIVHHGLVVEKTIVTSTRDIHAEAR